MPSSTSTAPTKSTTLSSNKQNSTTKSIVDPEDVLFYRHCIMRVLRKGTPKILTKLFASGLRYDTRHHTKLVKTVLLSEAVVLRKGNDKDGIMLYPDGSGNTVLHEYLLDPLTPFVDTLLEFYENQGLLRKVMERRNAKGLTPMMMFELDPNKPSGYEQRCALEMCDRNGLMKIALFPRSDGEPQQQQRSAPRIHNCYHDETVLAVAIKRNASWCNVRLFLWFHANDLLDKAFVRYVLLLAIRSNLNWEALSYVLQLGLEWNLFDECCEELLKSAVEIDMNVSSLKILVSHFQSDEKFQAALAAALVGQEAKDDDEERPASIKFLFSGDCFLKSRQYFEFFFFAAPRVDGEGHEQQQQQPPRFLHRQRVAFLENLFRIHFPEVTISDNILNFYHGFFNSQFLFDEYSLAGELRRVLPRIDQAANDKFGIASKMVHLIHTMKDEYHARLTSEFAL